MCVWLEPTGVTTARGLGVCVWLEPTGVTAAIGLGITD